MGRFIDLTVTLMAAVYDIILAAIVLRAGHPVEAASIAVLGLGLAYLAGMNDADYRHLQDLRRMVEQLRDVEHQIMEMRRER